MTTTETPVEFVEEGVPFDDIETALDELIELYGGETTSSGERERKFVLPLRRGVAAGGGVECIVTWTPETEDEARVRMICSREVDAPKAQRVALLIVGVIGSLLFMMWPFAGAPRQFGALAWVGGALAIAVYFMARRRTSGGIAYDFMQRLVSRQRFVVEDGEPTSDR